MTEDTTNEDGKQVLRKEKRELPVPLTADERQQMARRLADLESEIAGARADAEELKTRHKEEKAKAEEEVEALRKERKERARCYREGTRKAQVEVEIVADYTTGTICPFRLDTGDPVLTERRLMTDDEKQMRIAGTEPVSDDDGGDDASDDSDDSHDDPPVTDLDANEMDALMDRVSLCGTEAALVELSGTLTTEEEVKEVQAWVKNQRPKWDDARRALVKRLKEVRKQMPTKRRKKGEPTAAEKRNAAAPKASDPATPDNLFALPSADDAPDATGTESDGNVTADELEANNPPMPGDDDWLDPGDDTEDPE